MHTPFSFVLNKQGGLVTRTPGFSGTLQVPDALEFYSPTIKACLGQSSSMEFDVRLFRGSRPSPLRPGNDGLDADSRERSRGAPDTVN